MLNKLSSRPLHVAQRHTENCFIFDTFLCSIKCCKRGNCRYEQNREYGQSFDALHTNGLNQDSVVIRALALNRDSGTPNKNTNFEVCSRIHCHSARARVTKILQVKFTLKTYCKHLQFKNVSFQLLNNTN